MGKKIYQLTKDKYTELTTELDELITKGRKEIADKLDWLRSQPTNEDDSPFSGILEDKDFLEKRIMEIKKIMDNSKIVEDVKKHVKVEIGSSVTVGFDSYEDTYKIVETIEADPINKKLSVESPVGMALLGARVGDEVTVDLGVVKKIYRVLGIK